MSTDDLEVLCEGTENTETQTEEVDCLFASSVYRAPNTDFFNSSEEV